MWTGEARGAVGAGLGLGRLGLDAQLIQLGQNAAAAMLRILTLTTILHQKRQLL